MATLTLSLTPLRDRWSDWMEDHGPALRVVAPQRGPWGTAIALAIFGFGLGLVLGGAVQREGALYPVAVQELAIPSAPEEWPALPGVAPPAAQPGLAVPVAPPRPQNTPAVPALSAPLPPLDPAQAASAPAWRRYAVAAPPHEGKAVVALVIDDMGLDRKRSARTINLPAPLTLSFLPYAEDLPQQTAAARRAGHEIMLHMPMEPQGVGNDPGPNAILTHLSGDELTRRIRHNLARLDGYVAVNNHMGSKATTDENAMGLVMNELRAKGLMWLDSRTTAKSVGSAVARRQDVPAVDRDVFLDDENSSAAVRTQLDVLEKAALKRRAVIAIGHPREETIAALADWIAKAPSKGIVIVPVTEVARLRRALPQG